MGLWFRDYPIEEVTGFSRQTIEERLGIVFTEIGEDYVRATMPVDERTRQPFGLLHGGASVVLAESLGSLAGFMTLNPETHYCVGLDINANHLRGMRDGSVIGTARPMHIGRRTQVWEIHIEDEHGRLISVARLTLAVLGRNATS